MNIGFTPHGTISKKKRIYWEGQFFSLIREFSDGITFFQFKMNQYYKNNEEYREYKKQYYKANKDKIKEKMKQYYKSNKNI